MTVERTPDLVVIDTSVVSFLAFDGEGSAAYRDLLAGRTIGLSYFVSAELRGREWEPEQRARLDAMYAECTALDPTESTADWYGKAHRVRREMGLRRVGDTDLWIIAHAGEYGVPYMSHDRRACDIARAVGVEVLTALPDWP